jgi:hypothetical protein
MDAHSLPPILIRKLEAEVAYADTWAPPARHLIGALTVAEGG